MAHVLRATDVKDIRPVPEHWPETLFAMHLHRSMGKDEHGHVSGLERQICFSTNRIRDQGVKDALCLLWRALESEHDLVKSEELEAHRKEMAKQRRR